MNKCVSLVQVSKYRWRLVSPTGKIMVDDLMLADTHKAETWVKAYISSWNDWSFKLIPKETK